METNLRKLIRISATRPIVKICGNKYAGDSFRVAQLRPDLMGWIFSPYSPRRVTRESACAQIENIQKEYSEIFHVAVFAGNSFTDILQTLLALPEINFIQLAEAPGFISEIRTRMPGIEVIPAIRLSGPVEDPGLSAFSPADWVIVDSFAPGKPGGTGQALDTEWIRPIARRFILAGGLTSDNVVQKLSTSSASGVDVASGVEYAGNPGRKDLGKVRDFIKKAKSFTRKVG